MATTPMTGAPDGSKEDQSLGTESPELEQKWEILAREQGIHINKLSSELRRQTRKVKKMEHRLQNLGEFYGQLEDSAMESPVHLHPQVEISARDTRDDTRVGRQPTELLSATAPSFMPLPNSEYGEGHPYAGYVFAAVVGISETGAYYFGETSKLAAPVIESIRTTLSQMEAEHARRGRPVGPSKSTMGKSCARCWMVPRPATWTYEYSGYFACRFCFDKCMTCFRWAGNGRWLVLPLSPKLREPSATPQDVGYYIRQGDDKGRSFPTTWEIEPWKRPRKWSVKKRNVEQGGGGDLGKAREDTALENPAECSIM